MKDIDMSDKCYWCGDKAAELTTVVIDFKHSTESHTFCSSECESRLRKFADFAEGHVFHFLLGLVVLPLVGFLLSILMKEVDNGGFGYFLISAGLGAVIIKYPFTTPQTIAWLGAKRSILLARAMGMVCVTIGIVTWVGVALGSGA